LKRFTLNRRTVLRGMGGLAVALPFLEAMREGGAGAQAMQPPKRLIIWYTSNGTLLRDWLPSTTGANFDIKPILKPFDTPALRPHLTVVSGIKNASALKVGGNGHSVGMTNLLTCQPFKEVQATEFGDVGWGGGISIDQELAKRIKGPPLQSIELGVQTQKQYGNFYSYISYADGGGSKNAVTSDDDPRSAFGRLFNSIPDGTQTRDQVQAIVDKRKSVLDFVQGDYGRVAARLGTTDRQRLEQHAALIRDLEGRIAIGPVCEKPAKPTYADNQIQNTASFVAIGKTQMDLLATTLSCDLARIGTLQWSTAQSGMVFQTIINNTTWGANGEDVYHHGISHQAATSDKTAPTAQELSAMNKISLINTWYAQQLAYLATRLSELDDVGGTKVLDNTTILWVSEVSEGPSHKFTDMPYVLLGGMGGALKTGEHQAFANKRTHNDLFITLGQAMGFTDFTTFGAPEYVTGPLDTLLV
jgi:hypothetical protein